MSTDFENAILQRLADLKKTTAELERELSDTRVPLERQPVRSGLHHGAFDDGAFDDGALDEGILDDCALDQGILDYGAFDHPAAGNGVIDDGAFDRVGSGHDAYEQGDCDHEAAPGLAGEACRCAVHDASRRGDTQGESVAPFAPDPESNSAPDPARDDDAENSAGHSSPQEDRTAVLINQGRRSVYRRRLSASSIRRIAAGIAAIAVLITILVEVASRPGPSWPASVAAVQHEVSKACQNPDVKSEPGQVNFACGKGTRQILWVFALMTSSNNPDFADARTGRLGLEPITPTQGGEIASSLNLHHPYDPADPIDSLQVAARAINNIVGGATLTGSDGNPVVQGGLESNPANCVRYTGSEAVISRAGFPDLCAQPVTSAAGQAALVADVYKKWIVGATEEAAQDAAVLFENAKNPGNPRVQSILKRLQNSTLPGLN